MIQTNKLQVIEWVKQFDKENPEHTQITTANDVLNWLADKTQIKQEIKFGTNFQKTAQKIFQNSEETNENFKMKMHTFITEKNSGKVNKTIGDLIDRNFILHKQIKTFLLAIINQ